MKAATRERTITLTVATRQQTPEEQRRTDAAIDLLLTDIVRHEIDREEKTSHGEKRTTR